MLVKVSNFKGIISISAINDTGNPRVDIVGDEWIEESINRYEPEYFLKMYGVDLYNYLLDYTGSDAAILSLITHVTEAAACYIYMNILRDRKGSYNGETIQAYTSEGQQVIPIEEKSIEVHNKMVQCNRNAIAIFPQVTWDQFSCYIKNSFIEFELC